MVKQTGLPVHDLRVVRRTVKNAMRDAGIPVHTTAALMGHSEEMSKRHYTAAHQYRIDAALETLPRHTERRRVTGFVTRNGPHQHGEGQLPWRASLALLPRLDSNQ